MKRTLYVFVTAVIVAAAAGYFYFSSMQNTAVIPPEEILPQNTIAFIQVAGMEKKIQTLKASRFGENLRKIDLDKLSNKLKSIDKNMQNIKSFKKVISSRVNQKAFMNIFGKDFTIAFLPSKSGSTSLLPEKLSFLSGFAVLSAPETGVDITATLMATIPSLSKIKSTDHRGITIAEYKYDKGFNFYIASFKGYLISSASEETLINILDSSLGNNVLATTDKFILLKKKMNINKRDSFFFFDSDRFYSSLKELSLKYGFKKQLFKNMQIQQLNYVASAGFQVSDEEFKSVTIGKLRTKSKLEEIDPTSFFSMIPEDSAMVMWQNNFNLKDTIEHIINSKAKMKNFESQIVFELGMDKKEFYENFSGELGILLSGVKGGGVFPVPLVSIFLNEKAADSFDKVFASVQHNSRRPISVMKKYFKDVEIKYVNLPMGGVFKPAWTKFNKRFIFAVNPDLIEKIIKAKHDSKSILNTDYYKFVAKGLPEKCNLFNFVNTNRLTDSFITGAKGAAKFVSIQNPENAKNIGLIIDDILIPLTDALKFYEACGQKSSYKKDIWYGTTIVKMHK